MYSYLADHSAVSKTGGVPLYLVSIQVPGIVSRHLVLHFASGVLVVYNAMHAYSHGPESIQSTLSDGNP